jgi:5-methylcytosine-specific restriction protein A
MPRPDYRSTEAQAYRAWYKLKAWQDARRLQLSKSPLCVHCKTLGRIAPATVVNHITPHKGDWTLFISSSNHESTCKPCHDSHIQSFERTGIIKGSTVDGTPLDPNHPWRLAGGVDK